MLRLLSLVVGELEFVEALVKELKQHQDAVCVDQKLRKVDSLVDAVRFEVFEHENEEIGNYHGRNNPVSIVLVLIVIQVEEIVVLQHGV